MVPRGKRIAFSAFVNGINQVFVQSADGSGVPVQITEGPTPCDAHDVFA